MTSQLADDIELLICLMRRDVDGAVQRIGARSSLDSVVEFARLHGLSVVLLRALDGSPLRSTFSAAQLELLEQKRRIQESRSHVLLAELEDLANRFTVAGQRFMLLKGPYLAARYYGDVDAREYVDLDLLVPRGERSRVFQLLTDAGYALRSRTVVSARLTSLFVHAFDFKKDNANLDLHFSLSRHPSFRISEPSLWQSRQTYSLRGRDYDVLSDEYELVFALLSLLRDVERGQPKFKNIVDLWQLLARLDDQLDWDSFIAARRSDGTFGPTISLLDLTLRIAESAQRFPNLHDALSRHADAQALLRGMDSSLLFLPSRFGLRNKLFCARVYDTSPAAWFLYWSLSLPFRMLVHRRPPRRRHAA